MIDNLNILELIKNSPVGTVDLNKHMFVYLPDQKNEVKNYMCSMIVSVVKYNEKSVNVSFLDLPKTYKGEKIDLIDNDDYNWHYKTMNPIKLASYKGSFKLKDFK